MAAIRAGGVLRPVDAKSVHSSPAVVRSRAHPARGQPNPLRQHIQFQGSVPRFKCMSVDHPVLDAPAAPVKSTPSSDVLEIWRTAQAVCFDVDSTVCIDEGIDELASFCGAGEAVAAWTARAMGGTVEFQDALAARLDLFRPSLSTVRSFLARNPPKLTPGIQDLVAKLHSRGTAVYLVSGGFRQMIQPTADILGIPKEKIFANRLLFHENGEFAGFDETEPTSRSGGKAVAISQIKKKHGYKRFVMIGDGVTDLEARMPGGADIFICYAGVQMRPNVVAGSDWCVLSFDTLIQALS